MTLTDRMTARRPTCSTAERLEDADAAPGRDACLSYTWNDDALKWLAAPRRRAGGGDAALAAREIYPDVDIASHIIGSPITVSWEREPYFMGAFKANLPGPLPLPAAAVHPLHAGRARPGAPRGIFLAGDDISLTAGLGRGRGARPR